MNVFAVHRPEMQSTLVYVKLGERDGSGLFQTYDGEVREVPMGTEPPLYMRIPDPIAEAVGKALAPRPVATERHLEDAMNVRDWALGLIDKLTDRSQHEDDRSSGGDGGDRILTREL